MQFPSRFSALRRKSNSHNAAEPRERERLRGHEKALLGHKSWFSVCLGHTVMPAQTSTNYWGPLRQLRLPHCVGTLGFQSVCWAAAVSSHAPSRGLLQRQLKPVARQARQRGAGSIWWPAAGITGPARLVLHRAIRASRPNHSLKLSANGVARWPSGAGASPHFAPAVQRATPLSPA